MSKTDSRAMDSTDLHAWRERQNLASWKATAQALGLPYWRVLRLKNGEERIPLEIELACISFECGHFGKLLKSQLASRYEALRYTWFCERVIKVIELPRDDARRFELAIVLLVGLTALLANDLGTTPVSLLNRILFRLVAESSTGHHRQEPGKTPCKNSRLDEHVSAIADGNVLGSPPLP
jgi:hypothetical protein